MKAQLETLLKKLDRKTLVNWVEEMRLGKPAYDFLLAHLRAGGLTRHQRANALQALFRLRTHGSEEEVFSVFREHARHCEIRVRTEAVKLLVGMMKLHDCQLPFQSSNCIDDIEAAIELGLEHDIVLLAREFITQHGTPSEENGASP